ncbi:mite allergen Der f 6-like [Hyposmocoma kahamanoa]|uniref:mite allergen Der f 6-like n=1 Tax=Hyposmocoma kahamanoa TaxID=1477025 RepID=UPI000E6D5E93|nr:mite allergen Der f 6-like [Hyposmocoma kahamanoa]XP_026313974.1 mite allergen Der f 6-like [Hyposmocoma kahamanoa]
MDVVELRNDVGLVRTKEVLVLNTPLVINTLQAMREYEPNKLNFGDVEVLGFGRTTKYEPAWALGNQLFAAKLTLVKCDRTTWSFCICAMSGSDNPRGVCSGDSGGPMVYNGSQIGITSMGPQECSRNNISGATTITSVFTTLHQYADIITRTIDDRKGSKQMTLIYGSDNRLIPHCTMVLFLLCFLFA